MYKANKRVRGPIQQFGPVILKTKFDKVSHKYTTTSWRSLDLIHTVSGANAPLMSSNKIP